jgi:hypothetical protein
MFTHPSRWLVLVAVVAAAAVWASAAAAASPREKQYGNPTQTVKPAQPGTTEGATASRTTAGSDGTLPLTGLQLGAFTALALGLVGSGLVVRRLGAHRKG